MPLRSVEAATRDDAIAAARDQFGPQARVVGVRRVRSGGVLGFFATERYVAEVAPDAGRPPVPPRADDPRDELGPSPLASAATATAAPSPRTTSTAPARNGAAAYAAEAVRPAPRAAAAEEVGPEEVRPVRAPRPATQAATRTLAWSADPPAGRRGDDQRVEELAELLAAGGAVSTEAAEPRAPAPHRPLPRTGGIQKVTFAKASWPTDHEADDERPVEPAAAAAPSPFTAALARMVANDVHVRQAVEDAVEPLEHRAAGGLPHDTTEERPGRSTPVRSADTAVWPGAARQEEETVGEQVGAPPSMPATRPVPMGVPTWAAEPEVGTAADSTRQEAIAEVLRAALARGHSDEALTGILRKVLDGASPQAALTEPDLPVVPERREDDDRAALEPITATEPTSAEPITAEPIVPWRLSAAVLGEPPAPGAPLPAVDIWGTPAPTPLWGQPDHPVPVVRTGAPICAEADQAEAAPTEAAPAEFPADVLAVDDGPLVDVPITAVPISAAPISAAPISAAPVTEHEAPEHAVVEDEATESAPGADAAEETELESTTVEEVAPLLARTASDPAPLGLSMAMTPDATSVMPPLSLLPPLPSSRGRGRPPVPPAASRPSSPATRLPADGASTAAAPGDTAPAIPAVPAPVTTALATVTRLPVPPLPAGPHVREREEPVAPATSPSDDVVGRLAALGLPARLLGGNFAADVDRHGLYAALTRALGLRLPAAPELPSGAGEVLFVVGPGVETLRAARSLAASLCLDPDRVQWASRGDLAGLAPEGGRMTTVDAAIARRQDASGAGTVTVVAVDAPMRTDAHWMAQMLAIWSPVAVWAVVEATRKPEDVEPWLDGMARVDALIVQDTGSSIDPAAVLHRVAAPVAVLDGVRATPHRWASLLCERLEGAQA